jgi:methionyl aminopeptidase
MIWYKTAEEIELMRISSQLVSKTIAEIAKVIEEGVSGLQIDKIAEEFIKDNGGIPSFKGYNNFPNSLCISINNQVVHGIPSKEVFQNGDIVSVDCGCFINGFHGDSAYTFPIGEISNDKMKLLAITRESLLKGIEQMKVGNRIGHISNAIQLHAETNGFSVVRDLIGHGIGRNLHEAPEVPNFGNKASGEIIRNGLVIAIEPMINAGKKGVKEDKDKWTIITKDGSMSAHFEHTVAIFDGKSEILSTFANIDLELKKRNILYV